MISDNMTRLLNDQIRNEIYSAHIYLAMACNFDAMGLKVFSQRFFEQYNEEMEHAMKILHYVLEQGGTVEIKDIPEPQNNWDSAEEMIAAALEHEQKVTAMIDGIAELAETEKDRATRSFINWYIDEQVEEEASQAEMLQMLQLAGPNVFAVQQWLQSKLGG